MTSVRRAWPLVVSATAEEGILLDVVLGVRAINGQVEDRTTLLMGLLRQEADRLRQDPATPGCILEVLTVAARAVAEQEPAPVGGRLAAMSRHR